MYIERIRWMSQLSCYCVCFHILDVQTWTMQLVALYNILGPLAVEAKAQSEEVDELLNLYEHAVGHIHILVNEVIYSKDSLTLSCPDV